MAASTSEGSSQRSGYSAAIVQNPTISLADDVAATKRIVRAQNGPVILVGHSYGGVVITEAGNDRAVVGLVYIAAFAPDKGESVSSLIKDPPPGAPVPPILPPGRLSLPRQGEVRRLLRGRRVGAVVDHILARRGVSKINQLGWSWGTVLTGAFTAASNAKIERLVLYAPAFIRTLDPVGAAQNPPVVRAPNGVIEDGQRYWSAGKAYYDPGRVGRRHPALHGPGRLRQADQLAPQAAGDDR
jgi:pimeloyl-ACP methyl ester carboxylesterase